MESILYRIIQEKYKKITLNNVKQDIFILKKLHIHVIMFEIMIILHTGIQNDVWVNYAPYWLNTLKTFTECKNMVQTNVPHENQMCLYHANGLHKKTLADLKYI